MCKDRNDEDRAEMPKQVGRRRMAEDWSTREDRVLALNEACKTTMTHDDAASIVDRAAKFYEFMRGGTLGQAQLGLATTQQLLDELKTRIELDGYNGGGGLDYRTVDA